MLNKCLLDVLIGQLLGSYSVFLIPSRILRSQSTVILSSKNDNAVIINNAAHTEPLFYLLTVLSVLYA